MKERIKNEPMQNLTPFEAAPVKPLHDGPVLLSSPSLAQQQPQVATVQTQNTSGDVNPLDRLELEVKALRQQALSTQASLKQLQTKEPDRPHSSALSDLHLLLGVDGAMFSVGILILASMFWWYGFRRPQENSAADTGFVDSRVVPGDTRQDQAPASFEALMPALDPAVSEPASVQQGRNSPSSPFAAHAPSLEFDPEAAAGEVERVRKSLADKRDARARQRAHDASLRFSLPQGNGEEVLQDDGPINAPQGEMVQAYPSESQPLEFELGDSDAHASPTQVELSPDVVDPDRRMPADDTEDLLSNPFDPAVATTSNESLLDFQSASSTDARDMPQALPPAAQAQTVDADLDRAVQLSLAHEFEALGFLQEARELATEALDSADVSIKAQAQSLLRQIDDKEKAQQQDLLSLVDDEANPSL